MNNKYREAKVFIGPAAKRRKLKIGNMVKTVVICYSESTDEYKRLTNEQAVSESKNLLCLYHQSVNNDCLIFMGLASCMDIAERPNSLDWLADL